MRVAVIAGLLTLALLVSACGGSADRGRVAETTAAPKPCVTAATPVGEADYAIEGIAIGQGAVWAAVATSVDRVDPDTARVTAHLRMGEEEWAYDVDAGEGAAWVATNKAVLRLDSDTAEVVARIELPRAGLIGGLAVGHGAVWVAVSHGPRAGEVLRVDPDTNEVSARISTRGYAGELEVGAGAVWVLSHPEYTDETGISETSLHRIDPATNGLVATPMREEGVQLGGAELPRAITSDAGSVWVGAFDQSTPFEAASVRVEASSNRVFRDRLGITRFFPFAAVEGGVWFYGPDADVSLLNAETLKVEASLDVAAHIGDADADRAGETAWLAGIALRRGQRSQAIRVDLR